MWPEFFVCLVLPVTIWYSIVLKRYDGGSRLRTLYEKLVFLYQRLDFKDSKQSFSCIFSVEDPLMALVMVSVALY